MSSALARATLGRRAAGGSRPAALRCLDVPPSRRGLGGASRQDRPLCSGPASFLQPLPGHSLSLQDYLHVPFPQPHCPPEAEPGCGREHTGAIASCPQCLACLTPVATQKHETDTSSGLPASAGTIWTWECGHDSPSVVPIVLSTRSHLLVTAHEVLLDLASVVPAPCM